MSETETDRHGTGVSRAHELVEQAFELMEEKLDQDEITNEDMADVYEALDEAYNHPDSDVWVTIVALGAKNQCVPYLPDNDEEPLMNPRDRLENIVDHEIKVTA